MSVEKKSVEFYLSKGLSLPLAEYFANGRKKLVCVEPLIDFSLILTYDDGEKRLLDCKPYLQPKTVFEPFAVYENFKRVYIDDFNAICWDINPDIDSNTVWNNKVDLCPDSCYVDSVPFVRGTTNA